MSSLVMRCPEVNTLFHLWINYICGERRLEHPAMWDVFCLWNQIVLLAATSFCNFIWSCLASALPVPFGWMHPQHLLGEWLWFGDITSVQFCFFQKEKSWCDFDVFFQIWQFWEGLLKRAGKFLECCSQGDPEWSEAPSQICDVPGNQSKTPFFCIYFSCLILQCISVQSRWNLINCIFSSPTSLTRLLKLNLTQIHVIPWLFSPTPLFPVGLAGVNPNPF